MEPAGAPMKIINKTHWRKDDLRAIFSRVAKEELEPAARKALQISVRYSRGGITGYAWYYSNRMVIRVGSKSVDPQSLAKVAAHEMAHTRGVRHKDMNCTRYGYVPGWREFYAWAKDMPIEKRAAKTAPSRDAKRLKKLDAAAVAVKNWTRKLKLAETKLKLWSRRLRALEKLARATTPDDETEKGEVA